MRSSIRKLKQESNRQHERGFFFFKVPGARKPFALPEPIMLTFAHFQTCLSADSPLTYLLWLGKKKKEREEKPEMQHKAPFIMPSNNKISFAGRKEGQELGEKTTRTAINCICSLLRVEPWNLNTCYSERPLGSPEQIKSNRRCQILQDVLCLCGWTWGPSTQFWFHTLEVYSFIVN